jgi:uncharacterized SAM-binding protein YcdF (DUF218 family)
MQLVRFLGLSCILGFLGLLLVFALTSLQGGRDERRTVDALVLLGEQADPRLVDHAFDLYRRGFASRIVLGGAATASYHSALLEHGIPDAALLRVAEPDNGALSMQAVAQAAREAGVASVLITGHQATMLRDLKIARDQGMRAFGAPLPGPAPDFATTLDASLAYWRYVLLGI